MYLKSDVSMSNLTKEEIKSLVIKGWKCNDYNGICKISSHKDVTNHLIYDRTGKVTLDEIAGDSSFDGNAIILHIGEIIGKLSSDELT